jgi:cytochrome c oxidase assembly factor CtaG
MRARLSEVAGLIVGSATIAFALLPPFEQLAERSFTGHMIQHELLMAVAAPIFVASHAGIAALRVLPLGARRAIGRAFATPLWRRGWRALVRPFDAWMLHAAAIWLWHVPVLFQAGLVNHGVHVLQHASFFLTGILFWWSIFNAPRRATLGLSVVSLFTTALHTAALGALLVTSRALWYPAYAAIDAGGPLSPLEDQQLAGLVMWIPAGIVYLVAALLVFRRWLAAAASANARSLPGPLPSPTDLNV